MASSERRDLGCALRVIVHARSYDVVGATTGRQAVDAAERDRPDLIILDLGLPDISGVEVIHNGHLGAAITSEEAVMKMVHMKMVHRALSGLQRRNAERLRRMYVGGKGNKAARRYARIWAWAFGKGLGPGKRWITLEVPGRKSGKPTRFPLGLAMVDGQSYLVSMLGNDCNWVRNVRANGGKAVIEHRSRRPVRLVEVPVQERPRLFKAYLEQVPGARPHVPVAHTQPVRDFEPIADSYPIFRIEWT